MFQGRRVFSHQPQSSMIDTPRSSSRVKSSTQVSLHMQTHDIRQYESWPQTDIEHHPAIEIVVVANVVIVKYIKRHIACHHKSHSTQQSISSLSGVLSETRKETARAKQTPLSVVLSCLTAIRHADILFLSTNRNTLQLTKGINDVFLAFPGPRLLPTRNTSSQSTTRLTSDSGAAWAKIQSGRTGHPRPANTLTLAHTSLSYSPLRPSSVRLCTAWVPVRPQSDPRSAQHQINQRGTPSQTRQTHTHVRTYYMSNAQTTLPTSAKPNPTFDI